MPLLAAKEEVKEAAQVPPEKVRKVGMGICTQSLHLARCCPMVGKCHYSTDPRTTQSVPDFLPRKAKHPRSLSKCVCFASRSLLGKGVVRLAGTAGVR